MRRSQINAIMADALTFLGERRCALPPFAWWSLDDWQHTGDGARSIVQHGLGWDITDFGSGDYPHHGLFLFTLRNGPPDALRTGHGKMYAEKILIVAAGQLTPLHFHWVKMEDIINRGGGDLHIQLYNSTEQDALDTTNVTVTIDGIDHTLSAGSTVVLHPGESITLPPRLYHAFWAERQTVLVGEVSLVNDDAHDNRFFEPAGRFPVIEEDEPPLHLLVSDYARLLEHLLGT